MTIELTLNNVKVTKTIPEGYHQVPFKHFLKVAEHPKDTNYAMAAVTDLDVETIKKAKIKNVDDAILALSFFNRDPELKVPDTCLGYAIPKDLGFETTAQYEDLKKYLEEAKKNKATELDILGMYPLFCALYACSHKHGSYNWKQAEEMAPEFLDAPATEVLAIGNFTLLKLIGLNLGIKNSYPKPLTRAKKLKLVLKSWVRSLVLPVQLRIWKRKLRTKNQSF
jgi:hypothetical protein